MNRNTINCRRGVHPTVVGGIAAAIGATMFAGGCSEPGSVPHINAPDSNDWSSFAPGVHARGLSDVSPNVAPDEIEAEGEYLENWQEWHDERAYPRGIINWDAYEDARRHRDGMDIASPGVSWNIWEFMGPNNLQHYAQWGEGESPLGGRTNAVAWDPENPAIIYAASACGGVWKTTDGGASWTALTDKWSELYTSSIAVNPQDPSNIIVGTGDFTGWRGSGIGLMISDNGGATWSKAPTVLFNNKYISDVVIDPDFPEIIVGSTGRTGGTTRVYRSENGGQSFSSVISDDIDWYDLAIGAPFLQPGGNRYYYAVGLLPDGSDALFYRSEDRGETWEELQLPSLRIPKRGLEGIGIDASPWFYRNVYLYSPSTREVFVSADAGETWTDITGDLDMGDIHWTQPFYSFRIHCFKNQGKRGTVWDGLLIANNDVVLSPYANGQWVSIGGPTYSQNARIHVDVHNFATDPSEPNRHLVTSDGGIYGWTYDDDTFYPLNEHYGTHLVNTLAVHPTDNQWMMGGTQDNGTPNSGSDLNNWESVQAGDTGFCAISQADGDLQFVGHASQLGREGGVDDVFIDWTDNGWNSVNTLTTNVGNDTMRHGTPIRLGTTEPNYVYFASNYLYRYHGPTNTWTQRVGGQKLSSDSYVQTFEIAPSAGDFIYTGSKDGELWMTEDGGQTWDRIDDGVLPDASYADISIDAKNPRSILVGFRGSWNADKLFQCKNTTAQNRVWAVVDGIGQNALPGYPINAIARHPMAQKTHWFVGTDVGVYGTKDGGQSWLNMTTSLGLPNVYVTDLAVMGSQPTNYLFASSYGRGFWRLKLKPVIGQTSPVFSGL